MCKRRDRCGFNAGYMYASLEISYAVLSDASDDIHLVPFDLHGGTWTGEPIPGTGIFQGPLLGGGHDPGHLVVCYQSFASDVFRDEQFCVRKSPSSWGVAEPLGALPRDGSFDEHIALIAMSADGSRVGGALLS